MPEIEFLDAAAEPARRPAAAVDGSASPDPRRREAVRLWAPAAVALLGAAVTLAAPWRSLYHLTTPQSAAGNGEFGVDGWGRYAERQAPFAEHGPRYGIVLCVGAGLLLLGAGLRLYGGWRRRRVERVGTGVLVGAVGVLGGGLGAAYLDARSFLDTVENEGRYAARAGAGNAFHFDPDAAAGPMTWFALAGLLLALAALALPSVLRRSAAPATPPGPHFPPELGVADAPATDHPPGGERYPTHADDEVLDG